MPVYPTLAFKNENAGDLGGFMEYLALFTLTNSPSGVMPVTKARDED